MSHIITVKSCSNIYDAYVELLREFTIINSRNEHLADDVKCILMACQSDNDIQQKMRQLTVNGMTISNFINTYKEN